MMPQRNHSNEIVDRVFLAVIALIMLGTIFAFNFTGETSKEKRTLAKLPVLLNDGAVNRNITKDIDQYIADRFGFRDTLVHWNVLVFAKLLKTSPSDKVVIGKNNFMFYVSKTDGDNLSDFLKINRLNSQELLAIKARLEEKAAWCAENGIKFLPVITPSKHSIYPENYPLARPDGPTRLDQIINFMNAESETKVMDLRPTLMKAKKKNLVYLETDTHWNNRGAYAAYEMIFDELKTMFPGIRFDKSIDYTIAAQQEAGGDLSSMIGAKKYGTLTRVHYKPKSDYAYTYEKNDPRDAIITVHRDKSLPTAIIFRDSFFTAVQPFTSTLFSKATYKWTLFTGADKKTILKDKPDVVIFEIQERYTRALVTLD